jgi:hypothetical protein
MTRLPVAMATMLFFFQLETTTLMAERAMMSSIIMGFHRATLTSNTMKIQTLSP